MAKRFIVGLNASTNTTNGIHTSPDAMPSTLKMSSRSTS